jgi:hypothetical protein
VAAAAVILAHDNPRHVQRLIGALKGLDLYLHVDAKVPAVVVEEMVSGAPHVQLVPRVFTSRASWNLVEAEIAGLRLALERHTAEHIIVLSGSCYPLLSVNDLLDELAGWRGRSRFELHPLPYPGWGWMPFLPGRRSGGGLWRFNHRFLAVRGHKVLLRGLPVPLFPKAIPRELDLHASSQWKIYARHHAEALLRVLDGRPELARFWRTAFVPEESAVASILSSPRLVGDVAEEMFDAEAWYIDWRGTRPGGHPRWLERSDFESIRLSRLPRDADPDVYRGGGKLFARKIAPDADDLLARIDAELRA